MHHTSSDILFEPVKIGTLTIPNRVVMAPMTREFAHGGIPGPDVAEYYRKRAHGGVGLIVTEGMAVSAAGAHDGPIPMLFQRETVAAAAAIADAVHAAGGKIMPQLWHVGVQAIRHRRAVRDFSRIDPVAFEREDPRAPVTITPHNPEATAADSRRDRVDASYELFCTLEGDE